HVSNTEHINTAAKDRSLGFIEKMSPWEGCRMRQLPGIGFSCSVFKSDGIPIRLSNHGACSISGG
ncbi:MAG: hypothetical protein KDA89_17780, partial [Planctomycetaceae bacterium]|nr:hypothetical protein [Planctomycetaceae bacterium]